jgi:hypothetical protein
MLLLNKDSNDRKSILTCPKHQPCRANGLTQKLTLVCITEALLTSFDDNETLGRPFVIFSELESEDANDDDVKHCASNACPHARYVPGSILHSRLMKSARCSFPKKRVRKETYRNTRDPAIPPTPPNPTKVALQNALFHCPLMLFA